MPVDVRRREAERYRGRINNTKDVCQSQRELYYFIFVQICSHMYTIINKVLPLSVTMFPHEL